MQYYLSLTTGATVQHPHNRVKIVSCPENCPVLFIQNQQTVQTGTGFKTSFYVLIYNSLADKLAGAAEFYATYIEVPESVVEQSSVVQIQEGMTQVNIAEVTQLQLYAFLLTQPKFANWELATYTPPVNTAVEAEPTI